MPEQMHDSESELQSASSRDANTELGPGVTLSTFASLCAAVVGGCFFLPWLNLLFVKPSGFDLAKQGGSGTMLWAIPLFSVVTILAQLGKGQKIFACITGLLPIFFFAWAIIEQGTGLMKTFEAGAYGSLVCGLILLILCGRLK